MKLTEALLGEHGAISALLGQMEKLLTEMESLAEVKCATALLRATLVSHAKLEDDLLFPALEPHLGPMGPLAVMRGEHQKIDRALEDAASADECEAALTRLGYAIRVAREHFFKEEHVLFGLARQALGNERLAELADRWAEARGVSLG